MCACACHSKPASFFHSLLLSSKAAIKHFFLSPPPPPPSLSTFFFFSQNDDRAREEGRKWKQTPGICMESDKLVEDDGHYKRPLR